MDPKKNGAPPSTYSEQFFCSGGSTSPREEAEAETERLKTRSDNPAGRLLFMEERLDREEARMERQREQWARERQAQFEQLEKERKAQVEHMQQILKVVDQAVVSGFENLQRARQLGEIANKEPPPRMSNAEGFVEVAKALFAHGESLISKVLERDPEAAQRIANLSRQVLGMPPAESPQQTAAAPEHLSEPAPAAQAAPPPSVTPPAAPKVVLGQVVAAYKVLSEEKIAELAESCGVPPEMLDVDVLVRAAAEQSNAAQGPAA